MRDKQGGFLMKSNKKIISILGILTLVFTGIFLITGSVDSKIVTNVPNSFIYNNLNLEHFNTDLFLPPPPHLKQS